MAQRGQHPATLASLPNETIVQIVSHCDKTTALVLARVSRHLGPYSDARIWRSLDLHVSYEQIVSQSRAEGSETPPWAGRPFGGAYRAYMQEEDKRAGVEARQRSVLEEKLKVIAKRVDDRKAGLVRCVRIDPRPGAVDGQIKLLDMASPNLEVLDIVLDVMDRNGNNRIPQAMKVTLEESLDFKWITSGLSFPSLTHITIGPFAIHFRGFINLLCTCSPNLRYLDVDKEIKSCANSEPSFPRMPRITKLQQLRIFSAHSRYIPSFRESSTRFALDLIERSPQLEKLSTAIHDFAEGGDARFFGIISKLSSLRSMQLCDVASGVLEASAGRVISSSLRTLVIKVESWWEIFRCLPNLPEVEAIFVAQPAAVRPGSIQSLSSDAEAVQSMIPSLAIKLRRSPRLRAIHTVEKLAEEGEELAEEDEELAEQSVELAEEGLSLFARLEDAVESEATTVIRSITHRGSELLHVRVRSHYRQTRDTKTKKTGDFAPSASRFMYTGHDGSRRLRYYREESEEFWSEYMDWEGHAVPLEIISEMRLVQGATEAEWVGRGIEVGEKAWKVLTDWRDGMLAESK